MSVKYWILVSDELMAAGITWPEGLRLAGPSAIDEFPDVHWHLVEDDNAPAELDCRRVELVLGRRGREGATVVVVERRLLP